MTLLLPLLHTLSVLPPGGAGESSGSNDRPICCTALPPWPPDPPPAVQALGALPCVNALPSLPAGLFSPLEGAPVVLALRVPVPAPFDPAPYATADATGTGTGCTPAATVRCERGTGAVSTCARCDVAMMTGAVPAAALPAPAPPWLAPPAAATGGAAAPGTIAGTFAGHFAMGPEAHAEFIESIAHVQSACPPTVPSSIDQGGS